MKRIVSLLMLFFAVFAIVNTTSFAKFTKKVTLGEQDLTSLAEEAYIFAYPLVMVDMTKRVMTNTLTAAQDKAPVNQFMHTRVFSDAFHHDAVAPSLDTLDSMAWLDLSNEPYVLHVPDENGRYYLMTMLDGWTEELGSFGSGTAGSSSADYVIVGPSWNGLLPKDLKAFHSKTNTVWLIGHTYCIGTEKDYLLVHTIQNQYTLTPLHAFGKPYMAPTGLFDSSINTKTPIRDQINHMDAGTYYKYFAEILKINPPDAMDAKIINKLAKLGIQPGQAFDITKVDPMVAKALQDAIPNAQSKIFANENATIPKNGWRYSLNTGSYGTDYLQRATVAAIGLGASQPDDMLSSIALRDTNNNTLNGDNRYVVHFAKDQLPPVKDFWSLTIYNHQYFFVNNPLNRYMVSPRDHLTYNPDGSLDIYIQKYAPNRTLAANWLPAPNDDFVLILRLYSPKQIVLNDKWNLPLVNKI